MNRLLAIADKTISSVRIEFRVIDSDQKLDPMEWATMCDASDDVCTAYDEMIEVPEYYIEKYGIGWSADDECNDEYRKDIYEAQSKFETAVAWFLLKTLQPDIEETSELVDIVYSVSLQGFEIKCFWELKEIKLEELVDQFYSKKKEEKNTDKHNGKELIADK